MLTRTQGMFATFVDFKKAYDTVDRAKLWKYLRDMAKATD